jgi:hypothetical protein
MPVLKHPTSPSATVSVSEDRAVKLRKRGYTDVEPQAPAEAPVRPVDDDEAVAIAQRAAKEEDRQARLEGETPDPTQPVTAGSASSGSEQPAKSASRDEWNAYAQSVGVNPDEYGTKDELIEAVEAA